MSDDITELRSTLFSTLRDLKEGKLDVDRAKAINETAQTIINTAKVEIDHIRIAGGRSEFIPEPTLQNLRPGQTIATKTGSGVKTVTQLANGLSVTRHKMDD